jgi:hypothetical protein
VNDEDPIQQDLADLHRQVDEQAAALELRHGSRLQCRPGCTPCCQDGLTVFEVEAAHIRRHHGDLLASGRPHPAGACAFLDEQGACRIYDHRPYVCRTQGLPLRWVDEGDDGPLVEYRDICPLNENGPSVERLSEDDCWTLGPTEGHLARLQQRAGNGSRRVALRELFRHK